MEYCKKCLQPNTRPNTFFDNKGICPACNYFEIGPRNISNNRKLELDEIVDFGKKNSSSGYDCIIGVSGGKDSMRQALYVKNVLKMNPLLVCLSYPPEQISKRGTVNLSKLISHGFDCINLNLAPQTWKKLMKKGFFEFGNWAKSTEFALFSSVPRLAIAYQIPLIWWGENPALQLGDMKTLGKTGADGNNLKHMNTLSGGDISWLLSDSVLKKNILQYSYPSDEEMEKARLRIVFLGYFWDDWSHINNANYSALRGLDVRNDKPEDIGEPFGVTALDEDWMSLNQMIKYYKFGFGRTTEYINEEIRYGRVSRDNAIKITKKYDGTCSKELISSFCEYINISVFEFWEHIDKIVNKQLFEKNDFGKWIPKFEIGVGL